MTYTHVQTTINELLTGYIPLSTIFCPWTRMFRLLLVERFQGRVPAKAFRRRSDELFTCKLLYHAYSKLLKAGRLIKNPIRLPESGTRLHQKKNDHVKINRKKNGNDEERDRDPRHRTNNSRKKKKNPRKLGNKGAVEKGKLGTAADWYKDNTAGLLRTALYAWKEGRRRAKITALQAKSEQQSKHAKVQDKFTQQKITSFFGGLD